MHTSSRFSLHALVIVAACMFLPDAAHAAGAMELQGLGAQIYDCAQAGGDFAWELKAPDARLFDAQGQDVGHHFAGPSWQSRDGSLVTGQVLASSAGSAGSIPWLVLRAKSHSGTGVFAAVTYIVRSRTAGGVAPAAGCDAGHAGAESRVDYNATYTFFSGPDQARP